MLWFSPPIFCPRWLSWTDVQVRFSSLLLASEYEDCANQTSCTDMPSDAYYPVLLPVTNFSTVWSSKVATLALTNSLGCGFGNSTRSWGLLSHSDCKCRVKSLNVPPLLRIVFSRGITWEHLFTTPSITGLAPGFEMSEHHLHWWLIFLLVSWWFNDLVYTMLKHLENHLSQCRNCPKPKDFHLLSQMTKKNSKSL